MADGGGSEQALIRMIRQLGAEGWECHVALPATPRLGPEYAAAGAVVHVVPMLRVTTSGSRWRWLAYAARWPGTVVRLWALARRLDVAVVHSNSLHSWYGWAAAALGRRPHVWHAREIVFQSGAALRLERFLTRHFATSVVAVSSAVAAQLEGDRVVVVLDDADRSVFDPRRAGSFRERVGVEDGAGLIGSVARVDVWKGFDVLLEAFPLIRAQASGAELVVAGGPVEGKESYYQGLAERAGSMGAVHWMGPLPLTEVADLMADLDVFVQVSTEPEPFGLVLVEALASGVPVVAGADGGPADVVTDPAYGRLVGPGDAAALAQAVLELLPPSTSSSVRRARPALRPSVGGGFGFGEVFADAVRRGRRSGRRRPGPGRPRPR